MAIRSISVGIDDSETSTGALAWAVGLARHSDASLQATHVWQTPFVCLYPWAMPSVEESSKHADEVIERALADTGIAGRADTQVLRGSAGPALTTECGSADLVVVGCTGRGCVDNTPTVGEVTLGATARYVLHHTAGPVAAVPGGAVWTEQPTVLVGIDGSPASFAAMRWAARELPHDSNLHAVQAIDYPCNGADIASDYELLDPIVEDHRRRLQNEIDEALDDEFTASGRTARAHVVLGYPREALLDPGFAADIVVVGDHADPSPAAMLGSVSDHTLRHSQVPVIVVPSRDRTLDNDMPGARS